MPAATQNMNYRQGGMIPSGDPNQVIPAGVFGNNPQSGLNPNAPHTNQLNPNNPRYAGHQERIVAARQQEAQASLCARKQEWACLPVEMLAVKVNIQPI